MYNKISFETSDFFHSNIISYGFFSRNGGFSKKPFNTLNCSSSLGDSVSNVKKNIKLALKILNLKNNSLIIGNQIHSNKIILINDNTKLKNKHVADGFVTANKNISLGILTADCAPVFFYDPLLKIIGAAHAGWKGSYHNICKSIVKSMIKLKSKPKDIKVIIGPHISFKNYEVNKNFYLKFTKDKIIYKKFFYKDGLNKYYFSLSEILQYQLKKLRVIDVYHINEDTYANKHKYFSHRRSYHLNESKTGRMINIIGFLND